LERRVDGGVGGRVLLLEAIGRFARTLLIPLAHDRAEELLESRHRSGEREQEGNDGAESHRAIS
jgi:hypothetical protein